MAEFETYWIATMGNINIFIIIIIFIITIITSIITFRKMDEDRQAYIFQTILTKMEELLPNIKDRLSCCAPELLAFRNYTKVLRICPRIKI